MADETTVEAVELEALGAKRVLIFGCTSYIGTTAARALAAAKYNLFLCCETDDQKDDAQLLRERCQELGAASCTAHALTSRNDKALKYVLVVPPPPPPARLPAAAAAASSPSSALPLCVCVLAPPAGKQESYDTIVSKPASRSLARSFVLSREIDLSVGRSAHSPSGDAWV